MNIYNRYTTERKIGEGTFSVTYLARSRTGEKVAVKHIRKDQVKAEDWVNELSILQTLMKNPHPNIVSCHEIIEDDQNLYIVEELLPRGDLLQYLTKHLPLKEAEIKKIFWTVVSAVKHLHTLGIVHRDIKLENLLLDHHGKIKLIDFNLSSFYSESDFLTRYCGSLPYCPPEVVRRTPYVGPEVDVWSLGVLLYLLLFSRYPFPVEDDRNLDCLRKFMVNLLNANYFIPSCHPFSNEVINLIQSIFCVDSRKRITLEGVIKHPWLLSVREESKRRRSARLLQRLMDSLTLEEEEQLLQQQQQQQQQQRQEKQHGNTIPAKEGQKQTNDDDDGDGDDEAANEVSTSGARCNLSEEESVPHHDEEACHVKEPFGRFIVSNLPLKQLTHLNDLTDDNERESLV